MESFEGWYLKTIHFLSLKREIVCYETVHFYLNERFNNRMKEMKLRQFSTEIRDYSEKYVYQLQMALNSFIDITTNLASNLKRNDDLFLLGPIGRIIHLTRTMYML